MFAILAVHFKNYNCAKLCTEKRLNFLLLTKIYVLSLLKKKILKI